MATAPDGRIFVNELYQGNIRVVTPTATLPWQVQAAPFATLPVVTGNEKGLLGIAVDPNFSQNGFVYVFYTAAGPVNRVVRFTATTSGGDTVATSATPVIIFDNIPAANAHNGGVIQFGPDGMLYIFVGENEIAANDAQNMSSSGEKSCGSYRIRMEEFRPTTHSELFQRLSPLFIVMAIAIASGSHSIPIRMTYGRQRTVIPLMIRLIGSLPGRIMDGLFVQEFAIILCTLIRSSSSTPSSRRLGSSQSEKIPSIRRNITTTYCSPIGHRRPTSSNRAWWSRVESNRPVIRSPVTGGKGGLIAVMHGLNVPGQDGYIYVMNQLRSAS